MNVVKMSDKEILTIANPIIENLMNPRQTKSAYCDANHREKP